MERVHDTPGGEREGERGREKRWKWEEKEHVGLKQSPRHSDLCRPAKHSHQSHRICWNCMTEVFTCLAQRNRSRYRL